MRGSGPLTTPGSSLVVESFRETESVTCDACSGDGFILWDWPDVEARCSSCDGSGEIEVCALCHDEHDDEWTCPRCQK